MPRVCKRSFFVFLYQLLNFSHRLCKIGLFLCYISFSFFPPPFFLQEKERLSLSPSLSLPLRLSLCVCLSVFLCCLSSWTDFQKSRIVLKSLSLCNKVLSYLTLSLSLFHSDDQQQYIKLLSLSPRFFRLYFKLLCYIEITQMPL